MIIGYARVSGKDQNLERQVESLKEYGCEDIYTDESTGKNFKRDGYTLLKKVLRPGDTLVVHEFDRLGRNKKLTLKELQYFKDNNIRVIALNLPTTLMNTDDNLMLETINNIVIELYTMMAQQEIETREKRQREGMAMMPVDKATGKRKSLKTGRVTGRPNAQYPKNWEQIYNQYKNKQIKAKDAIKILQIPKSTFYKLVKQFEENEFH